MSSARHIEELRAEARYARQRYDLYRAKMYGLRPTTLTELNELERIHRGASARLRRAEQEHASAREPERPAPSSDAPPAPVEDRLAG